MQRTPSGSTERIMSSSASLFLRSSSVSSSWALSKWSSIARLLRPVTKIISVMPAAAASSTAYWMSGLSTIGSISFGLAFVTGRKRLPRPATGNTAFLSFACMELEILQHFDEFFLPQYLHAERACTVELRAGVVARNHVIGFFRHGPRHFVPLGFDGRARLLARHARERPGEHETAHRAGGLGHWRRLFPAYPALYEIVDDLPVVLLVEKLPDRARDHRAHVQD